MRGTVGLDPAPACLDVSWILGHFGPTPKKARIEFNRFVDEGRALNAGPLDGAWHRPRANLG